MSEKKTMDKTGAEVHMAWNEEKQCWECVMLLPAHGICWAVLARESRDAIDAFNRAGAAAGILGALSVETIPYPAPSGQPESASPEVPAPSPE